MAAEVAIIVVVIVLLIVLFVLYKSLYIVHQAEGIVVERLGRYDRVLRPGINFLVPFLEAPRTFTWRKTYIDVNSRVVDKTTTDYRIDLRESVFNFLRQSVYTKDTILLDVNALMYYSIGDVRKAIYEVEDLQTAISNVAQTQLKDVFGGLIFAKALESQEVINNHMQRSFARIFIKWGIIVHRIELQDVRPKSNIGEALKKQMIAERARRGDFIRAEGQKAAVTLTSEGTKIVKFNMGIAEQEATRKKSEGAAGAKVEMARAESQALETIAEAIQADGVSQTEYMIGQRYMDMFRALVLQTQSTSRKVVYLPYEVTGMRGIIAQLPSVFGTAADRAQQREPARRANPLDELS